MLHDGRTDKHEVYPATVVHAELRAPVGERAPSQRPHWQHNRHIGLQSAARAAAERAGAVCLAPAGRGVSVRGLACCGVVRFAGQAAVRLCLPPARGAPPAEREGAEEDAARRLRERGPCLSSAQVSCNAVVARAFASCAAHDHRESAQDV